MILYFRLLQRLLQWLFNGTMLDLCWVPTLVLNDPQPQIKYVIEMCDVCFTMEMP